MQEKEKKNGWNFGTWKIRGRNRKEEELLDELEKTGIEVLALTETKSIGSKNLKQAMMILNCVKLDDRARAEVEWLVYGNIKQYIY